MFDALDPSESVVDRCARQLRRAILEGRLEVGERMPPERSLAEQFDVHRGTVRAALDRLSEEGLVDVRQGRGYQVKDYRKHAGPDLLGALASVAAEEGELHSLIADLLLVRRQLAAAVLGRVQERRESLDPAEWTLVQESLAGAVDAFEQVVEAGGSTEELAAADLGVAGALVAAAGSPVFSLCMNPLAETLRSIPRLGEAIYREPAANLAGWRLLQAWVAAPKLAPFEVIMDQLQQRDDHTLALLKAED